ncbi:MAG: hypothetical protein WCT51_01325 [Candidatus Shapirobacteria bacterium]|jgi:hypothetical protein
MTKKTLSFSEKVVKGWSLITIATKLNSSCPNQSEERRNLLNEIKRRPVSDIMEWTKAFIIGLKEGKNPELKDHQAIILQRLAETKLNENDLRHINHRLGHITYFHPLIFTD